MTYPRTDYPAFSGGYTRSLGTAPIMLDGMEVLFDRTVGLAPVTLVPKKDTAVTKEATRD
ncbi:MAG TPA: hypothetical protein VJ717_07520 [Gemmatimonadaceae bacterium]|nr:hypothetical protein [Gemmatimonadaceae bacterium]